MVTERHNGLTSWRAIYSVILMMMKRMARTPASILLVVVLLLAAATVAATSRPLQGQRAYTLAQLVRLGRFQQGRLGQVLLVKGTLSYVAGQGYVLSSRVAAGELDAWVAAGPANPVLSRLRAAPLIAPLVPATPDHPVTGREATYRITRIFAPSGAAMHVGPAWQLASGGE